jgi:hypothetical protein
MPLPPWRGPAGQHARRGLSRGEERSTAFPAFQSGEARTVIGTGRARANPSSIRRLGAPRAEQEDLVMPHLPSLKSTDCVGILGPPTKQKHEAENILKTKGRVRPFFQNEAEN